MTRPAPLRKPRARSQARIDSILDAARTLLATEGVASLSIYSVAERAGIPPSSVYHFFASVPALLEALTADVHSAFRACLQAPIEPAALTGWRDLSRLVEQRMLQIYSEDAAARQLILAQHGLTEVTQADRQHDLELGDLMHTLFDQHFELPALPTDVDVFALAMELGDRVYARSVQQHGQITRAWRKKGCGCLMRIWGCICRRICLSGLRFKRSQPATAPTAMQSNKKPRRAHTLRGCSSRTAYNLAIETSVDFTKAITSLPITSSSSFTERVVITEVTMPEAVCTSISDSTSPSTISLMVPLNWLRTLMALIVMGMIPVVGRTMSY